MNTTLKRIATWSAALAILVLAAACSGRAASYEQAAPMMLAEADGRALSGFEPKGPPAGESAKAAPGTAAPTQAAPIPAQAGRKLVKTAEMSIRVKDLKAAMGAAEALVLSLGGYVSYSGSGADWASMTLRVPQASFESALNSLGPLGEVMSRSSRAEDVTVQFYDLEGRLKTKKDLAETFRSYLRKANTIDDILAVEARLAELQAEIDGTGQELRGLTDRIDYATISVQFSIPASKAPVHREGLGEKLAALFGSFGSFMAGLVTVLVGIVVFGVPVLAIVAALWWLLLGRIGLLRKLWGLIGAKRKAS